MTPNELGAYLDVLKNRNLSSAFLELPGGGKLSVVFGPEPLPEPDRTSPAHGGWKSEGGLDASLMDMKLDSIP